MSNDAVPSSAAAADTVASVELSADYAFDRVPSDLRAVVQSASVRLALNPVGYRSLRSATGDLVPGTEGRLTPSEEDRTYATPDGFSLPELQILQRYRRTTYP